MVTRACVFFVDRWRVLLVHREIIYEVAVVGICNPYHFISRMVQKAMKSENWLIWSYEHDAWWKPNSMGYTRKYLEAGRYSEKEAEKICKQADIGRRLLSSVMPPEIMVIENVAALEFVKHGDNW